MPLCPFSGLLKTNYEKYYYAKFIGTLDASDTAKYKGYFTKNTLLLDKTQIPNVGKMQKYVKCPFFYEPIRVIKALLKDETADRRLEYDKQLMNNNQLEQDACRWVNGWIKQFKIKDIEDDFQESLREGRNQRVKVLADIICFCLERDYKPVLIIPPVTKYLSSKFSEKFRENYIYSFIRDANVQNVPFLNYLDDDFFSNPELFFNSFFMNLKGRKLFTEKVLEALFGIPK